MPRYDDSHSGEFLWQGFQLTQGGRVTPLRRNPRVSIQSDSAQAGGQLGITVENSVCAHHLNWQLRIPVEKRGNWKLVRSRRRITPHHSLDRGRAEAPRHKEP